VSKNVFVSLRRREFLAALAALGATTLAPDRAISARGQAPSERSESRLRIDLHHHFASPRWSRRHAEITGTVRDDSGGISVAGGQGFGVAYQLDGATHNNPYDN
jgi:hypothetical protein